MQPSARQAELEHIYQQRKLARGHAPHISISDDSHHVTEAIGSYYGDEQQPPAPSSPQQQPSLTPSRQQLSRLAPAHDARPLSYMDAPSEVYESRGSRRGGGYFDMGGDASGGDAAGTGTGTGGIGLARASGEAARSSEMIPSGTGSPTETSSSLSLPSMQRITSRDAESRSGSGSAGGQPSPPPPLSRQGSTETAVHQFPLNDIDYESSPAAVAQELSNLQAIRRMSMNVDAADPDLPSFGGAVPTVAPKRSEDANDASQLFWVPAHLHPELAPKEFKTFIEDRVDKIRRRSGDDDTLSAEGLERSGSSKSSLRRKKSMLSHQIDTKGNYQDGAERLERKRSKGVHVEAQTTVTNLSELENLVNDPQQLVRRMSLDTVRRSQDSGVEVPPADDMPILPPVGQSLKRSTRTTYRRGSLKKGERVPFSKRVQQRHAEAEAEELPVPSPRTSAADDREHILGLTRVQTEPIPPSAGGDIPEDHVYSQRTSSRGQPGLVTSQSSEDLARDHTPSSYQHHHHLHHQHHHHESQEEPPMQQGLDTRRSPPPVESSSDKPSQRSPQPRKFHSRLASGPGRTTAQLPGYNNQNPLPNIIETLPDGTKVPVGPLVHQQQQFPERKSSHELQRPLARGGAHMRPAPGRQQAHSSSTLDDISSNPSPLPGSGNTRTDALTMVPTFDDRKVDKKDSSRKSSWKWILGNDDDDKEKKAAKEDKALDGGLTKSKNGKTSKPAEKARLDVLQSSIDGRTSPRGRESLVLNRADIQLEDERRKESKKASEPKKDKDKESSLLSAIFGGKKKSSDSDLKEKRRKSDHRLSPDPPPRILKPDIDYNWTRFSILEERAIYRMAHMKLANPRRALYSQVLLSNFMYSYLAKVQQFHLPASQQRSQPQREQQPAEYSQYQRWQQQQERDEMQSNGSSRRTSREQQPMGYEDESGYDPSGAEEYDSNAYESRYSTQFAPERINGILGPPSDRAGGGGNGGGGGGGGGQGYSKGQPAYGQDGLWDDERSEDLW